MNLIKVKTNSKQEIIDITDKIQEIIKNKEGKICFVYCKHTTAALTINENDDPLVGRDILYTLNKIIPDNNGLKHKCDKDNAAAHVKSSLLGHSKFIPLENGKLNLGTWQGVFFVEFDGPREREVVVGVL